MHVPAYTAPASVRPFAVPVQVSRAVSSPFPTMLPDRYLSQTVPVPPKDPPPESGTTKRRFFDRISPLELAGAIGLHVGGGALIAGVVGAGIAAVAGGAALTGLAIGAGIGAVLGGVFLAAVLAFSG